MNWHDSPLCKCSDHSLRLSHIAAMSQIKAVNFWRCLISRVCRNVAIYIAGKLNSSPTKHVVLYMWNTFLSYVCLCVRVHRGHYSDCAHCWKGIFLFAGRDRDILLYRVFMPAQGLVGGFSSRDKSAEAWSWSPTFLKCQGSECAKLEFQSSRCLYGVYRNLCLFYTHTHTHTYLYIFIYRVFQEE